MLANWEKLPYNPRLFIRGLSYLDRLHELTRTMIGAGTFDGAERIVCVDLSPERLALKTQRSMLAAIAGICFASSAPLTCLRSVLFGGKTTP
jgi:hypothetical protein